MKILVTEEQYQAFKNAQLQEEDNATPEITSPSSDSTDVADTVAKARKIGADKISVPTKGKFDESYVITKQQMKEERLKKIKEHSDVHKLYELFNV